MADYPVSIELVRRKLLEMRDVMDPYAKYVLDMAISKLEGFPAMDVVHGRWVRAAGKSNIWYCSVCGDKINYKQNRRTYNIQIVPVEQKNKFCRNCGAKMDAKEVEADGQEGT